MARWRSRVEHMRGSEAYLVTPAIVAAFRFPFPQSLQKSGNSYREVHRLSRFRDHRTACYCLGDNRPQYKTETAIPRTATAACILQGDKHWHGRIRAMRGNAAEPQEGSKRGLAAITPPS